jgi:EAL domain-containing protein (putative c-di-GMP-specific phosphodiesterase class I)
MDKDVGERLRLSNDLRLALARNEFVLHYQPQIDLRTQQVIGAEALIRWQHPELGLLAPGRFIGIAEDTGLIVPIGEWVIRMACHQAAAWQRAGLPPLVVAVNLSAVQFMRGDLVGTVASALATSALPSRCLELELTESILIQDAENILGTVQRLNAIGVQMSIDDFGTGYSSLSYLKRFAVDKLKVDQSFVRDLCSDPDDAAIVRAIIQLARSLGLKTIAEGVETAEILALLQELGCDEAQGYYFAKPLPADNFGAFLSQRQS